MADARTHVSTHLVEKRLRRSHHPLVVERGASQKTAAKPFKLKSEMGVEVMAEEVERLVERLRARAFKPMTDTTGHLMCEAADAIDALHTQEAVREEALEEAAAYIEAGKFDASVHLSVADESISHWFRRQQAAGIRSLKEPAK